MAQPTLVYGGTTVTLPYPDQGGTNEREYVERRTDKRTLTGKLRVQRLSRNYVYRMHFTHGLVTTYDAIVSLWETAVAAGGYPTFTFNADGANKPWGALGVTVAVKISAMPTRHDFTRTDWDLELVEVEPR